MKTAETDIELGRTLLKSTSHMRVRETKGSYARSIAVGFQFAAFLPSEIMEVVIWPLIRNILGDIFIALDSLVFVIWAAIAAVATGFTGCLEAADDPIEDEADMEQ